MHDSVQKSDANVHFVQKSDAMYLAQHLDDARKNTLARDRFPCTPARELLMKGNELKGMDHSESGGYFSARLRATAECAPIRLESRKCVFDIQALPFQTKAQSEHT